MGGLLKLGLPYARYTNMPGVAWSKDFKPWQLRLIGILEASGGTGLIAPLLLPTLTVLAPLAALGIALYMAGAMATHLRRDEYAAMAANLMVFLTPALLVAYGRLLDFVR